MDESENIKMEVVQNGWLKPNVWDRIFNFAKKKQIEDFEEYCRPWIINYVGNYLAS